MLLPSRAHARARTAGRRGALAWSAGSVALILAASGAAQASVTAPATAESGDIDAGGVLQAVTVGMGTDGALTSVEDTVVDSPGSPADAGTDDHTYSPGEVASDLPVRVVPTWRTAEGAGSDLSDLEGYDGRVRIDLTVQNLTVRPRTVQYDVDGQSREQAALVGSPLSVVAAAELPGLAPTKVVTAGAGTGDTVTNGVVSRGSQQDAQVQWGALLAPPQLGSSSRFTLVVDAEDFEVPDIDISVQPGLVTDPSMQALVDAVFNPRASEEMDLQARTVEVIGDVNAVLARASETISQVRSTLTSTAETLGARTVTDLQASTESVAGSMRTLDGALRSLDQDLTTTLESTGSSAIAELQKAVDTVDTMLGDTSRKPGAAQVLGNGCNLRVAKPRAGGSLYDSLVVVASQLNGFAGATGKCQAALQQTIRDAIGPAQPTAAACQGNDSVTCSLHGARGKFDDIADDITDLTDTALDLLQPALYADAVTAADELDAAITRAEALTALIGEGGPNVVQAARQARNTLRNQVVRAIDDVATGVAGIRAQATSVRGELDSMQTQAAAAAQQLCNVQGDGTNDTLTPAKVEAIRAYLVSVGCDGTTPLGPPSGYSGSLSSRLQEQSAALDQLLAQSDPSNPDAGVGQRLAALRTSVAAVADDLDAALNPTPDPDDPRTLEQLIQALQAEFQAAHAQHGQLIQAVDQLEELQIQVEADITAAVQDAKDRAAEEIAQSIDPEIRKVSAAGESANQELGVMFSRSAEGLRGMAADVVTDGRATIKQEKSGFAQLQEEAAQRVSTQVEEGLGRISSGVASSSRDMKAATSLLTGDLRRVLLDLGERRVDGGGLLGAMSTGAATARTADYQLALATRRSAGYANVRGQDIAGLLLRQAQTDAAMQSLAEMPAFQLDLAPGVAHRTVYTFRLDGDQ